MSNRTTNPDYVDKETRKIFTDYYNGLINKFELSRELYWLSGNFFRGLAEEIDERQSELLGKKHQKRENRRCACYR